LLCKDGLFAEGLSTAERWYWPKGSGIALKGRDIGWIILEN
jgi:hypothetical protein